MKLFQHQIRGAEFLASRPFAGLFFGMGTGKTITALEACDQVKPARIVIIGPPISLPMWQRETQNYLHREAQILKTGKTPITSDIVIVSYAIAMKRGPELRDWLNGGVLICDESHALKSVKAKRTKAIIGRGGITDGAGHSWMLTGTPITRWNDDMYPFLVRADMNGMKGMTGSNTLERFQLRYTVRQKKQFPGSRWPVEMVVGNRNTQELAQWTYRHSALRVDLEEVFKSMPALTTNRYTIALQSSPELNATLKELSTMSMRQIEEELQSSASSLSGARRMIGEAKVVSAANEIAERIESGQKILVGAWHRTVIDALRNEMIKRGYSCGVIDGRSGMDAKTEVEEAWNDGKLDVVIGQIAAMGVSLNLQRGGHQIIVVESDWSPAVMDQFYARLWRYGQEKPVHVDILDSSTKIDDALARISSTKAQQQGKFNSIGRELTS